MPPLASSRQSSAAPCARSRTSIDSHNSAADRAAATPPSRRRHPAPASTATPQSPARFPDSRPCPQRRIKHDVPRVAASRSPQLDFLDRPVRVARPAPIACDRGTALRAIPPRRAHAEFAKCPTPISSTHALRSHSRHSGLAAPNACTRSCPSRIAAASGPIPASGVRRMQAAHRAGQLAEEFRDDAVVRRRRRRVVCVVAVVERRGRTTDPAGRNRVDAARPRPPRGPPSTPPRLLYDEWTIMRSPARTPSERIARDDVVARHRHASQLPIVASSLSSPRISTHSTAARTNAAPVHQARVA